MSLGRCYTESLRLRFICTDIWNIRWHHLGFQNSMRKIIRKRKRKRKIMRRETTIKNTKLWKISGSVPRSKRLRHCHQMVLWSVACATSTRWRIALLTAQLPPDGALVCWWCYCHSIAQGSVTCATAPIWRIGLLTAHLPLNGALVCWLRNWP